MIGVGRFAAHCLLFVTVLTLGAAPPAVAHQPTPVITTVVLEAESADLAVRLDLEAVLSGLASAQTTKGAAEYERLRALPQQALRSEFEGIAAAFLSGFELQFDGVHAPLRLRAVDIPEISDAAAPRISTLSVEAAVPRGARSISWRAPSNAGDGVVRIFEKDGRVLFAGVLQPGQPSPEIDLASGGQRTLGFVHYVALGFTHIVPEGLDHILFVAGLFLLSPRLKPLLGQVTAFTVAHSITLALGIFGVLRIPPAIVEPLIAASIVFIAVENLLTDRLHKWRPIVVFGFGLVHGLGFAGVLAEIGLPQEDFVSALVGFNLGVELGQLVVIGACFLAVGLWFRHATWYRVAITRPASLAIAATGVFWFIERVA